MGARLGVDMAFPPPFSGCVSFFAFGFKVFFVLGDALAVCGSAVVVDCRPMNC